MVKTIIEAYTARHRMVEAAAAEHFSQPGLSPPMAFGTNCDDLAWLEENAKAPGVISLPCGLQYKVLKTAPAVRSGE